MTLKNTDKFIVKVKNRQTNSGDTEYITERGEGTLRINDGKYYIMYKTDSATVMIRLEMGCVNVTRVGEIRSDMEYRAGKTTRFMYNTPYGAMEMELYTKSINYSISACGGEIRLRYTLCDVDNDMQIVLKKKRDDLD